MIIRCPNCGQTHIVSNTTTDFICDCTTGEDSLDKESVVVIVDWEDYTGSGTTKNPLQAGRANTVQDNLEMQRECVHIGEKNILGRNKSTNRLRQHEEYFEVK